LLAYFVYRIREKTESIRSKNAFPKKKKVIIGVDIFFALDRERAEKAKTENEEEKK